MTNDPRPAGSARFFIDTADTDYILNLWNQLQGRIDRRAVVGITTNPSAMAKCNIHTLRGFDERVRELCRIVTAIRQAPGGVVYVQHPSSTASVDELIDFAQHISGLSDGRTRVGLKIPPHWHILQEAGRLAEICDINVTGVADCSTALMCFSYPVRYVSIITGRMEEKGIDANAHLAFVDQRNGMHFDPYDDFSEVITGSMRTLKGLQDAITHGTVPTIGTKVWDLILADASGIGNFNAMWDNPPEILVHTFSPHIDQRNTDLSVDFFKQMDLAGEKLEDDIASHWPLCASKEMPWYSVSNLDIDVVFNKAWMNQYRKYLDEWTFQKEYEYGWITPNNLVGQEWIRIETCGGASRDWIKVTKQHKEPQNEQQAACGSKEASPTASKNEKQGSCGCRPKES